MNMLLLPFEPMTDSHLLPPSTCSTTLCQAALLCYLRSSTSMVAAKGGYLRPGVALLLLPWSLHKLATWHQVTWTTTTVNLNISGVSPLIQNMRTWISCLALFASLVTVTCESKDTLSAEALDEKLERYIALLEKKRDAIDKFLNENYSSFNHTDFDAEEYVAHPINAYMLMKRTSVLWQIAKPGESLQSIHTSNLTKTFL